MFDFSFGEIALLTAVALVVLGPEKLPHTMRMLGAWIGRIRRTVISIQSEIEKEVAAQEMRQRIDKEMARMRESDTTKDLQREVDDLNASLRDVENQLREKAQENTILPTSPEAAAEPPPEAPTEKPGEEAFKAYVQSSHAQEHTPDAPAKPEAEPKATP